MADQGIDIPITVTGEEAAAQALNQTAAAADNLGKSVQKSTAPMNAAAGAADKKAKAIAQLSTVTGSLSPIVGRMSTDVAKLTQVFSTAGSTITGMTSVIGGPFGLAIGAAVAATGLFVTSLEESKQAALENEAALRANVITLEDYIATAAKQREEANRASRIAQARGTVAEQQGALEQQRAALDDLNRKADEARNRVEKLQAVTRGAGAAAREAAVAQLRSAEQARDAASEQIRPLETALALAKAREDAESDAAANAPPRHEAARKRSRETVEDLSKIIEAADRALAAQLQWEQARASGLAQGQIADMTRSRSQGDLMNEASIGDFGSTISDASWEAADAGVEAAQQYEDAWSGAFSMVGSAASDAAFAIISGQEMGAEALLMSVGSQLWGQGTQHFFQGVGFSIAGAGLDPRGPALMTLGGTEMAVGASMGAVGGAIANAPSSGSGGASAEPAAPSNTYADRDREAGGDTVINFNNVLPDAYAYEKVIAMQRRDRNRRGKAAGR